MKLFGKWNNASLHTYLFTLLRGSFVCSTKTEERRRWRQSFLDRLDRERCQNKSRSFVNEMAANETPSMLRSIDLEGQSWLQRIEGPLINEKALYLVLFLLHIILIPVQPLNYLTITIYQWSRPTPAKQWNFCSKRHGTILDTNEARERYTRYMPRDAGRTLVVGILSKHIQ